MITQEEVARSIHGAIRLATFDPRGFDFFDDSDERFWKSFWAAAFVAPFHLFVALAGAGPKGPPSMGRFFVIVVIFYVIWWSLWPLIMVSVTRSLGRFERFNRYMMAYNWAQFVGIVFMITVAFLSNMLFPQGIASIIFYAGIGAVLAYEWFIARNGLQITKIQAAGLVAFNVALSFGLRYLTEAFAGT